MLWTDMLQDRKYKIQDTRYKMQDTRYKIQNVRYTRYLFHAQIAII